MDGAESPIIHYDPPPKRTAMKTISPGCSDGTTEALMARVDGANLIGDNLRPNHSLGKQIHHTSIGKYAGRRFSNYMPPPPTKSTASSTC